MTRSLSGIPADLFAGGRQCGGRQRSALPHGFCIAAGLFTLASAAPDARAQMDPQSLSTNLPVRLKDAFVADVGDMTIQDGSRVTVGDDGSYSIRGGPTLKLGLPGRVELSFQPLHQFGDAASIHGGLAGTALEWNINRQGRFMPAFLVALIRDQPYGGGHQGPHYHVQAVATKSLGSGDAAPRLDFEISWTRVVQPGDSERHDRLLLGIAWSCLLDRHTALVTDIVHQQQAADRHEASYIDMGFNRVLNKSLMMSLGVGPGIAQTSAAARVLVGLKWTIKGFLY